jgi:hypothetical protein
VIATILRILLLGAFVILIALAAGLAIMAGVAQSHDVVRIPLPSSTFIASTESGSDGSDAYVAPLNYSTFRDIDRVAQLAFHKGQREVFRDEHEVAYEGETAGVHYYISYILVRDIQPPTLIAATTVQVQNKKGRYYWRVVKHVHRRLMPYMLDRMSIMAPD